MASRSSWDWSSRQFPALAGPTSLNSLLIPLLPLRSRSRMRSGLRVGDDLLDALSSGRKAQSSRQDVSLANRVCDKILVTQDRQLEGRWLRSRSQPGIDVLLPRARQMRPATQSIAKAFRSPW